MGNDGEKIRISLPKKEALDIAKVIEEFNKAEASKVHRQDAFKIHGDFEDAVRKIAKAKPKKPSRRP